MLSTLVDPVQGRIRRACGKSASVMQKLQEAAQNSDLTQQADLPRPKEIKRPTWIEEFLITRDHLVGKVLRLQKRNTSSYFALAIFLPQNTARLVDLLPMSPTSWADVVCVVWVGSSMLERNELEKYLHVRKQRVYDGQLNTIKTTKKWILTMTHLGMGERRSSAKILRPPDHLKSWTQEC